MKRSIVMKVIFIMFFVLTVMAIMLGGCMCSSRSLRYDVSFINVGSKPIIVKDITLYESTNFSKAGCGELYPGVGKSCGVYYESPAEEIIIEWVEVETKKTTSLPLKLKLPEIFYNARNGSEIRLSINPDTKNVNVAYRVFSQNCNDFILVDSESKILDNGM